MRRRDFITLLSSAAVAWPIAARAQQPAMPVIGYLSARSPDDTAHLVAAFRRGLGEGGFVEGQNVTIEYRWALGQYDRLPAMAAELARRPVAILATTGGEPAALAAKAATSTIPIVFLIGGDPVKVGLAASYNRPGGNATGMNILTATLEAKRLGLLHELVPQAATIGVLLNPNFQPAESQLRDVQEAARTIGLQIHVLHAGTDRELDAAFDTIAQQRIAALAVTADPFFDTRRDKLVALAARHAVPTMYHFREFAAAGGLISYGIDTLETNRQLGAMPDRFSRARSRPTYR
jgi:putative ABC transport system substrate-binding protein